MGLGRFLPVIVLIVVVVIASILSLGIVLHELIKSRSEGYVSLSVNRSVLVSMNVPIYVVGPQLLVQELVSAGVNRSLIKSVSFNELLDLPNNSVVIIDWSVIEPYHIINEEDSRNVNTDSMAFRIIMSLINRGDFLIIHGNSVDTSIIEYVLALAWSRAFNTSIVAMPIPKYLYGLNYIIAHGNDRVLIIGPHSLDSALRIANNVWLPIIMKENSTNFTDDLCTELAWEYKSLMVNKSVIHHMAYAIIYGEQSYVSSLGITNVDFCVSWMPIIVQDYNGYIAGNAEFYNYIEYSSNSMVTINYLKSFQDAYASYIVYEWERGWNVHLPNDVFFIASNSGGYEPGYWTNSPGFDPGPLICTKNITYTISMDIFYHLGFNVPTVSRTYTCSYAMISLFSSGGTATPIGSAAVNLTWVYQPYLANATEVTLATESIGLAYAGTAYVPRPTVYTIPVGVLARLSISHCGFLGLFTKYEYISYYIDWLVWVNVSSIFGMPGHLPTYYGYGNLIITNLTNDGFYIETQCG